MGIGEASTEVGAGKRRLETWVVYSRRMAGIFGEAMRHMSGILCVYVADMAGDPHGNDTSAWGAR